MGSLVFKDEKKVVNKFSVNDSLGFEFFDWIEKFKFNELVVGLVFFLGMLIFDFFFFIENYFSLRGYRFKYYCMS